MSVCAAWGCEGNEKRCVGRNDLTNGGRPGSVCCWHRERDTGTSAATSVETTGAAVWRCGDAGKCLCTVWCEGGEYRVALGVTFPRPAVDIA